MDKVIPRAAMSEKLRNSAGSIGTTCDITRFADEINNLINSDNTPVPAVTPVAPQGSTKTQHYEERSLHRLFITYLRNKGIYAKTIFHEKSSSKTDQAQKWVHPDIVAAEFEEFKSNETNMLLRTIDPKKSVTLYSYEMKREINTDYELKQYFFQALSNSNWANYGYLVAFYINEELTEEMRRLNQAFGIGIIRMQPNNGDTTVLYPARENRLDYDTIDKLSSINPDFRTFIDNLSKVMMADSAFIQAVKNSFIQICDTPLADNEIEDYCKEHNIPF